MTRTAHTHTHDTRGTHTTRAAHMAKSATSKKSAKKPSNERSNLGYMNKIVKKCGTSSRGVVNVELNCMLTFLLGALTDSMSAIMTQYTKKDCTVKPKVAQAAFQLLLHDDLRASVCDAGATALVKHLTTQREKGDAQKAKKAAAAEGAADPEVSA